MIDKRQFYLVNVCAWCPKENYPKIHMWQKYTHGLCEKHYRMLSKHKEQPATLQEIYNRVVNTLFPKQRIHSSL
jgi:hypothetical protein